MICLRCGEESHDRVCPSCWPKGAAVTGREAFKVRQSLDDKTYVLSVRSIDKDPWYEYEIGMSPPIDPKHLEWHLEVATGEPVTSDDWEAKIRTESKGTPFTFRDFVVRFHGWKGAQIKIPLTMFEQMKKEARQ